MVTAVTPTVASLLDTTPSSILPEVALVRAVATAIAVTAAPARPDARATEAAAPPSVALGGVTSVDADTGSPYGALDVEAVPPPSVACAHGQLGTPTEGRGAGAGPPLVEVPTETTAVLPAVRPLGLEALMAMLGATPRATTSADVVGSPLVGEAARVGAASGRGVRLCRAIPPLGRVIDIPVPLLAEVTRLPLTAAVGATASVPDPPLCGGGPVADIPVAAPHWRRRRGS